MTQPYRHNVPRRQVRTAQAVAVTRSSVMPAALTTLILGVSLGLLLGAGWMQLT